MEPDLTFESAKDFVINAKTLPDRFHIVGALKKPNNGYVVIGIETNMRLGDHNYCSWLYDPRCGFIYGHYGLTEEEAYRDLIERG